MPSELKNTTETNIVTSTGHVVPAEGMIFVDDFTLNRLRNDPFTSGQIARGNIVVTRSSQATTETAEVDHTRAGVARMTRKQLLGVVETTLGEDPSDFDGVKVEDDGEDEGLRSYVARRLFEE